MSRHFSRRRPRPSSWIVSHVIEKQEVAVGSSLWLVRGVLDISMTFDAYADSDADGNRGREMVSEDHRDWTLADASPCGADGEWGEPLTGAAIPADVVQAAHDWAMSCDPPDPEPYEPEEPDYEWRLDR